MNLLFLSFQTLMYVKDKYNKIGRSCYLLRSHVILVCKYRKNLLSFPFIDNEIIFLSKEILEKYKIIIEKVKSDNDHIHYLISYSPRYSISWIITLLKSYTTFYLWKKYPHFLSRFYYKKRIFWTSGYFSSSIGNVSKHKIINYIENQGL